MEAASGSPSERRARRVTFGIFDGQGGKETEKWMGEWNELFSWGRKRGNGWAESLKGQATNVDWAENKLNVKDPWGSDQIGSGSTDHCYG